MRTMDAPLRKIVEVLPVPERPSLTRHRLECGHIAPPLGHDRMPLRRHCVDCAYEAVDASSRTRGRDE